MEKIVTLTMNPAVDKNSSVRRVVAEWKLRCSSPTFESGGGGINVSRVLHRFGQSSMAYYPAGGETGLMLENLLCGEQILHHQILIEGLTRENLTVYEEATGQQYRFGMPGPCLSGEEWKSCLNVLSEISPEPDYLVVSGSLPPGVPDDFYTRLAKIYRPKHTRVILDTSGNALALACQESVYLLKPNLKELRELVGYEFQTESEQYEAANELIRKGVCEVLVLSLGSAGALLVTKSGPKWYRSPTVPIQSKIGAGDSMMAGIVLSLARQSSVEEAVLFGVAAGAAAVMSPGSELCRPEDVERLLGQMRQEEKWSANRK